MLWIYREIKMIIYAVNKVAYKFEKIEFDYGVLKVFKNLLEAQKWIDTRDDRGNYIIKEFKVEE